MKKFIALLMAAILMALTFAGCQSKTTDEDDSTVPENNSVVATSDRDYVVNKGKLVVGITEYAPMDYKEEGSDEWIGFDADLAKAFAKELGVEVEFIVIDWDNKFLELSSKKIDCIWNGMTITDEVMLNSNCSNPYVKNAQVVVMAADKADAYKDAASMSELTFAVESGSAGESVAVENEFNYTSVTAQSDALMEVQAGTADACIIDITMANAMTGEGTSYSTLKGCLELSIEEYGVAFRKGSELTDMFNKFIVDNKDAVVTPLAEKYELTLAY